MIKAINTIAVVALVVFLAFFIYALSSNGPTQTAYFRLAFYCLLFIVACMELRIRLGLRLSRGWVFKAHLICAIPFFITFAALAFWISSLWLELPLLVFGFGTLVSGTLLFHRSLLVGSENDKK